jgi:hypothetical protein
VQWGVAAVLLVALAALAWFGGPVLAAASRRNLRRIIREELAGVRADGPASSAMPPRP